MGVTGKPVRAARLPVSPPTPISPVLVAAKLFFAFFGFSALVAEVVTLLARNQFLAGNFFSYFTVESNTLAVISLVLSGLAIAAGRGSRRLDFFRGAVAFCMTTTLLIFIVLLSGYPASELTALPWDNTVLHYIMPIVIIIDWLVSPRVGTIPARRGLLWLALPLLYLVYSLIRGPLADWYPYPFMDPSLHGYLGVAITSLIIAVVLGVIAVLIAMITRWNPDGRR